MSNIALEDFNTQFVTHVRAIEREHDDLTGTFPFAVGFNIVCLNNNRAMYFESHIASNAVPPSPSDQQLVDAGWSNLITDVKTWATNVVNSSNIIGTYYFPAASNSNMHFATTTNFPLASFTSNFDVTLARFEVYPPTKPSSWCVGFNVASASNANQNMYVDTNVVVATFAQTKAETEIMDLAWSNVKETIGKWAESKYIQPVLVNTLFTSSNW